MKSEITTSWEKNVKEWTQTIQNQMIPSRKFTNTAIIDAITALQPKKVADFGCGEGWLTREMRKMGLASYGYDAIEGLLEEARKRDQGNYHQLTFEDIISEKPIPDVPFDLAVFNFCIYLKDGLKPLLENTLKTIHPGGHILIQTLHPFFLFQNNMEYRSQWISDSWKGLPGKFIDGHSWYARTFEDWVGVLDDLKSTSFTVKEVTNDSEQPISLLIQIRKSK